MNRSTRHMVSRWTFFSVALKNVLADLGATCAPPRICTADERKGIAELNDLYAQRQAIKPDTTIEELVSVVGPLIGGMKLLWTRAFMPGEDTAQIAVKSASTLLMEVGLPSVVDGARAVETIRVGRWMSQAEYDAMKSSGKVQESFSGTTHVANPADATSFINQAKPGSLYVEFDVPVTSIKPTNEGWVKIIGPNSLEGRLAVRKWSPIPEMPAATNIFPSATKLP